jgi:N-methylhydantoinase A/oxoprolinase/acetone carboxylase beta subunit
MKDKRKIKIGIDVGGTFTHAVAIDATSFKIIGAEKVLTTHNAKDGVASGIVQSLMNLLRSAEIQPDEVVLIAHSTTQATNALLEGDVAVVGIVGIGSGFIKRRVKNETFLKKIELAPGKYLQTCCKFIDASGGISVEIVRNAIEDLVNRGAEVIVASDAFSVDDPAYEKLVLAVAAEMGVLATAACQISRLYGLRVRTRTAVINACMLPIMLKTAEMTERSVKKAGITAPLMVMRSDGGIMNINEVRKRPILTMLSGPAAGVAAALMYTRVSDGIFIEVGGTSTDITAIQNGRAKIRSAEVGGHRLYISTLDVRTLGIAGGSMPRISDGKVIDIGPRSAHISNMEYASFSQLNSGFEVDYIQPMTEDPSDYLCFRGDDGKKVTLTTTCAANLLGYIPDDDYAKGNKESVKKAFQIASEHTKILPEKLARDMLTIGGRKIEKTVRKLIEDYELNLDLLTLVGGGGGASAIIPMTAELMDCSYEIAENNAVISAIGVALAMVKDTIERTVVKPGEEDILSIRCEVEKSVLSMGAAPDTIETFVEIDSRKNILRATAIGSTEISESSLEKKYLSTDELGQIAAHSMKCPAESVNSLVENSRGLHLFYTDYVHKRLGPLFKERRIKVRIITDDGVIRWAHNHCAYDCGKMHDVDRRLSAFISRYKTYGDAGTETPKLFIVAGGQIYDYSGLIEESQIYSMTKLDLKKYLPAEPVWILGVLP